MKTLVIERSAIINNLRTLREKADGAQIIADLSANAYGMGLVETAKILRDDGVTTFAVSDPKDARALRTNGFTEEHIMMLRSTADPDELEQLIDLNVVCTIGSNEAAVALNGIAEARKTHVEIQIKIDTGLGRYGFSPDELDRVAAVYKYMPRLIVVGTFTTYACPWDDEKLTKQQLDTFSTVLDKLSAMGLEPGSAHICDGAALLKYDLDHMDAIRADDALTGRIHGRDYDKLEKVGYIEASLAEVGWFPKGHKIGAEKGIVTRRPSKIAVISVGFYNGFGITPQPKGIAKFLPFLRRKPIVKIGNQKVKILGDIGMQHTLVDVTKVNCSVGDIAVMEADPINVKGLSITYR